ncbi:MAG: release factor glutamine methyltransferase, partial [Limisphaerales bacterium]
SNIYRELGAALKRLKAGEPIAYITGISWFYERAFKVSPAVLIPRPETEELTEKVLQTLIQYLSQALSNSLNVDPLIVRILDIGTGSGCIPITLAAELNAHYKNQGYTKSVKIELLGIDLSEDALGIAKENAKQLLVQEDHISVSFESLDFLDSKALNKFLERQGKFDVLVSNPPYIGKEERDSLQTQVVDFEPGIALFSPNEDPLIFYKRIAEQANNIIKGNIEISTNIFLEISALYGEESSKLFLNLNPQIHKDISGRDRIITARYSS